MSIALCCFRRAPRWRRPYVVEAAFPLSAGRPAGCLGDQAALCAQILLKAVKLQLAKPVFASLFLGAGHELLRQLRRRKAVSAVNIALRPAARCDPAKLKRRAQDSTI